MRLRELQSAFATAILTGKDGPLLSRIVGAGMPGERRLAIYRADVFHNLREALRAVYPVVERLVGERFFRFAADTYIGTDSSRSGDIQDFGCDFPDFLDGFAPAAQLAYLPDTARLEWAVHQVFHAPDHPPLDISRLANVPPDRHVELRLVLHPACRLLSSAFPVHRIWDANQATATLEGQLDVGDEGVSLLVRRRGFVIGMAALPAAEFQMLLALAEDEPIGGACDRALQVDPGFDLAAFLRHHVAAATIVDFRVGTQ